MTTIRPRLGEQPMELVTRCEGRYVCPRDSSGKPKGRLTAYAGKYIANNGEKQRYVGFEYINFAKVERHTPVLYHFAQELHESVLAGDPAIAEIWQRATAFCGAPEGGKGFANQIATINEAQWYYPEKEVIALATETDREKSKLVWGRHAPNAGEKVVLIEDVCNNFSTTERMIRMILDAGATVVAIGCFLNRSPEFDNAFVMKDGTRLPIISRVRQLIPEYKQNDPEVTDLVDVNRVSWDPKQDWDSLMEEQFNAREDRRN